MDRYKSKDNAFKQFLNHIYISFIPNKHDNLKQILIKLLFVVSLVTMIVSVTYLALYFKVTFNQNKALDNTRNLWHSSSQILDDSEFDVSKRNAALLAENPDFKGWITIDGTNIDNPIYQTTDNDYYLSHNQLKQNSRYGALFFDKDSSITEASTDNNLVIYGHNMKDGTMFASLKNYKSVAFYKQNPTINFSTLYDSSTYKIYSVFVLNASKSDDNGYIYNIMRKQFYDDSDFKTWSDEAFQRSLINTGIDVNKDDKIITLVTCINDFDNARLVVMARKTRENEEAAVDTSISKVNPSPRYPKRWYDDHNIEFPF